MKTRVCHNELIDIIVDLQERGFDHDFIIDHEHIRCLQYNELIAPDDFDILETHLCIDNLHVRDNYVLCAIHLKYYHIKGILMSSNKAYSHCLSQHLWQKFHNEVVKGSKMFQPLSQRVME